MQMNVVASLAAATAKGENATSEAQLHKIVDVVRATGSLGSNVGDAWRNNILLGGRSPRKQRLRTSGLREHGFAIHSGVFDGRSISSVYLSQNSLPSSLIPAEDAKGPRRDMCYLTVLGRKATKPQLLFLRGFECS